MFNIRSVLLSSLSDVAHRFNTRGLKQTINRIQPEYDTDYLTNPANFDLIKANILNRKGIGDIDKVHSLTTELSHATDTTIRENIRHQLDAALKIIPNRTHPDVANYGDRPKEIASIGAKRNFNFAARPFDGLCNHLNILRTFDMEHFHGSRSYYFMSELAELEEALIQYTVDKLDASGFELIAVPEILPPEVIEGCGMTTTGERHQVFRTLPDDLCLSGTSEMALGGFFAGKRFHIDELPIRVMAVSHCHRAETSTAKEDKGTVFRVHSFAKVEMFSVCAPNQSEHMLDEFKRIEIDLYSRLNLHFTVLDMPPCELGAPAYRKFDIEAWMPGRGMYGEISSCSNCTDYQSRRLDIRFNDRDGHVVHAHTVNGTGCAVPRMLMAIVENGQNKDYTIDIPAELQRYMDGKTKFQPARVLPGSKRAQIDETNVENSSENLV